MTEVNKAIEDAPEVETPEAADNESETQEDEVVQNEPEETEGDEGEVEFPKKAVNALNRKNKQLKKQRAENQEIRAKLQELEAKLNETPKAQETKQINPDDYENYGDYINAQVEALVEQKTTQSQTDLEKQQLRQQKEALKAQRDQYIIEQAQEASQVLHDLPQVWQQNAQLLDSLPEQIADIFYSIDNAPAAIYALAKEGKLESLLYANPNVAAYEIVNAQNRGMELMSKPQQRSSQAPTPISKAKGTGSTTKTIQQMSGRELLDRFAK